MASSGSQHLLGPECQRKHRPEENPRAAQFGAKEMTICDVTTGGHLSKADYR